MKSILNLAILSGTAVLTGAMLGILCSRPGLPGGEIIVLIALGFLVPRAIFK